MTRAGRGDAVHGQRAAGRAAADPGPGRLVAVRARAPPTSTLADSISAVVILAQVRSITADLLELTGMDYARGPRADPGDGLSLGSWT